MSTERRVRHGVCIAAASSDHVFGHFTGPTQRRFRFGLIAILAVLVLGYGSDASALTSQSIAFGTLAGKVFGNSPFAVSATASSGLAVSFSSTTSTVCRVSGTTVTIIAAGVCTIRASQAGNATYSPAPNVDRSFTAAKAAQTITFAALAGKTVGNPPFTVSATASSGLAVTLASTTTPVCTMSGSTVTIVAAGTCTVTASQAGNGNYNAAANVGRSFTVAKAAQTITFATLANKTFGNAPFPVSATASSGLTVTFSSTTTAVCTVTSSTVTIVAAGTCTVRADQSGNGNYNAAASVSRSFSVAKAAQTITFGALGGKTYGNPAFTVSATSSSGLAVGFASTTTTICTVSGSTVSIVSGGTCTVRASQAGNANYNAASNVNQSFTIARATQTIAFGAIADRDLGSAPFDVTATSSSGLAVSFATLTEWVCDVTGSTVTLWDAGICTVEAQQGGNINYVAATPVSRSFTVKGAQTIAFAPLPNLPVNAGAKPLTATATSGLTVSFVSTTPTICSVPGNSVSPLVMGVCTIRASQGGDAIYYPAPTVDQSFSVLMAQRTVQYIYDAAGNIVRIQVVGP